MNFTFSPEQLAFVDEVQSFLDANDDPEVFDLTRENMAQIVDTPKRRQFMRMYGATVHASPSPETATGRALLEKDTPRWKPASSSVFCAPLTLTLNSIHIGHDLSARQTNGSGRVPPNFARWCSTSGATTAPPPRAYGT